MSICAHKSYQTAISAKKAARQAGGKGLFREIERCPFCSKWKVK